MKRRLRVSLVVFATLFMCAASVCAKVRLPHLFDSGMVLQRDMPIHIWGWADAGEEVVVSLGSRKATAKADARGEWSVTLAKMKAGGPYELRAGDVVLHDVMLGDVFFCSGQSNMELPIRRCMDLYSEEASTYSNADIRYLTLAHLFNFVSPQTDFAAPSKDAEGRTWKKVNPANAREMSAICYFFSREVQAEKGVPVGIIVSAVGGTKVEAWMSQENLRQFDDFKSEFTHPRYNQVDYVDSVTRVENARMGDWDRRMDQADTVRANWRKPGFTTASWQKVNMFGNWAQGPDGRMRHGAYWFRQVINVPASLEGHKATLRVGAMKDADSVFVNGVKVGFTSYEYPPRIYPVPAGVLKAGENEVMVRLLAQSGRPNFTPKKLYQLEIEGGEVIPLKEEWEYCAASPMPARPGSTYWVDTPTGLYNAMVAPFRNLSFKAAVWYQGESSVGRKDYALKLEAMVKEWRKQFGHDFPLVIVQLAGFQQRHDHPVESGWAALRNLQRIAAQTIPNAALATPIDIGEWNDIHPQNKKDIGHRVALQLFRIAYGDKKIVSSGPEIEKAALDKEGNVVLTFSKRSGEIDWSVLKPLESLSLAGADGKFVAVKGRVSGPHQIVLTVPAGMVPERVRYAWDDYPLSTIYNVEGLPASGFEIEIAR